MVHAHNSMSPHKYILRCCCCNADFIIYWIFIKDMSLILGKFSTNRVILVLVSIALLIGFCINWNTYSGSHRLIVTHHKTGTSLSHKIRDIFRGSSDSKLYYFLSHYHKIDTNGYGISTSGLSSKYTHVIHFIRNPFAVIISAYHYHKKAATEQWLQCPLEMRSMQYQCAVLTYTWPAMKAAVKAVNYVKANLHEQRVVIDKTNFILNYPMASGHSYQSYLNMLDPLEGIILEYFRSTEHTLEPMHQAFRYIVKRQADNMRYNPFNVKMNKRALDANKSYHVKKPNHLRWDDKVRDSQAEIVFSESYRNVCLEHISEIGPDGAASTPRASTFLLTQYLGIKGLTWRDMSHFHLWINLRQGVLNNLMFYYYSFIMSLHVGHTMTNHTRNMSTRRNLTLQLRVFDKVFNNGAIHEIENTLSCPDSGF